MAPTFYGAGTWQQQQHQDALTMKMLNGLGDRCNLDKSQITRRSKMQRGTTKKNYSKLQIFGPSTTTTNKWCHCHWSFQGSGCIGRKAEPWILGWRKRVSIAKKKGRQHTCTARTSTTYVLSCPSLEKWHSQYTREGAMVQRYCCCCQYVS